MILAAPPEERLFEGPQPSRFAARSRATFVLLICFLLHAIPISLAIYLDRPDGLAPGEQEIPIEMVVEPPPPKEPEPAPPKSEEKAPQATLDEKFANDAPRAANDEKPLKDAHDDVSHAPKAEQGADAVKPAEASSPKPTDHRADPVEAAEAQQPDAQEQAKAEPSAPKPETQQQSSQNPLAAFAATPDYSFAPASRNAPVAGGKAASTYLSILYGMVFSHIRQPNGAVARPQTMGEISFNVDLAGRLLQARIVKSCGSPEIDAAAIAAIRAAAPYPPPPTGTGLSLNLHYGK